MTKTKTKKSPSPAFAYTVERLKRNPNATYADIRDRAAKKHLAIPAVVYGRVKLHLGLVKAKPKPKAAPQRNGTADGIAGIGAQIERIACEAEDSRARAESYRETLEAISDLVESTLGE